MWNPDARSGASGQRRMMLFALQTGREFAAGVAAHMGVALTALEERDFEGGEHKSRPLESVRDADVYIVQGLDGGADQSVNDRLCRLLFFVGTLRDHGAARVTVLCPYLGYARKDRRTKPRDPVTTRYVAQVLEAVGVDRVVGLEVHNPAAFENAFRVPTVHLHARGPLARALLEHGDSQPLAVVSPDTGGAKRAAALRDTLAQRSGQAPTLAFMEKHRSEGVVSGDVVAGEVDGRTAVIVDDLISSGTTILRAVAACRARGATGAIVAATHAVFTEGAERLFGDEGPDRVFVTDSVPPRLQQHSAGRIERISVQPLFADVIRALHEGTSLHDVIPD